MSGLDTHALLKRLRLEMPIVQAPMAGVSTPSLAASVSEAGGLGFLGLGASGVAAARQAIRDVRARTARPFGVNLFCHQPASRDAARERRWIERLTPEFARYGRAPPAALDEIYRSFLTDGAMLDMLLAERPPVVSFHFGLPPAEIVTALRNAGIVLVASVTSLAEARFVQSVGLDAVVAQGYEAGGHRGIFDPDGQDDRMGVVALTRVLVTTLEIPVIAAGGIMDGAGIAAMLRLGATMAQLGTAYIGCPESAADAGYRAALFSDAAHHTVMTRVISGRPARCLANRFTVLGRDIPPEAAPAYPVAYDLGKALNAAAKGEGVAGYGAQWAGQGAPLARALPAADLTRLLIAEAGLA